MKEKDIINKKIEGLKAPIDKQALWNNIENHKDFPSDKNNRKRFLWLLPFAFLALISFQFLNSNTETTNSKNSLVSEISKSEKLNAIDHTSSIIQATQNNSNASEDGIINNTSNHKEQKQIKQIQTSTNSTSQSLNRTSIKQQATSIINTKTKKTATLKNIDDERENKKSKKLEEKNVDLISRDNASQKDIAAIDNKSSQWSQIASTPSFSEKELGLTSNNTSEEKRNSLDKNKLTAKESTNTSDLNPTAIDQGTKKNQSIKALENSSKTETKTKVSKLNFAYLNDKNENPLLHSINEKQTVLVNEPSELTSNNWQVDFSIGIGSAIHQRSMLPGQDETEFNFQNDSTKSIESFISSINVKRNLNSKWQVGLGVQYYNSFQRINSELEQIQFLNDSTSMQFVKETETTNYKLFQKHHFVDLQLMAYRNISINKHQFYLGMGLGYNVNYRVSGKSLKSDGTLSPINGEDAFNTKLGHHYVLDLGYNRPISKNMHLFSSIEIKSPLQLHKIKNNHTAIPFYLKTGVAYKF